MNYDTYCHREPRNSKREQTAFRIFSSLVLAVLFSGCATLEPGSDGDASVVGQDHATFSPASVPQGTLVCGTTYRTSAGVTQNTAPDCADPQLGELYDRATAHVDAKIDQLNCPAECAPKAAWISDHGWLCTPGDPYSISKATVSKDYMCPRPNVDTPPNGLQPAGPNDFGQSRPVLVHTDITEDGYPGVQTCASRSLYKLVHSEEVRSCVRLRYDPIIQRAEDEAKTVHGSLSCAAGCSKLPYQAVYRAWGCNQPPPAPGRVNTATVEIYFQLNCPL